MYAKVTSHVFVKDLDRQQMELLVVTQKGQPKNRHILDIGMEVDTDRVSNVVRGMVSECGDETVCKKIGVAHLITWGYACSADVDALYSGRPYETLRAIVIRVNGEPAGIIGLAKEPDRDRAFSEYRPSLAPHLRTIPVLRAIKEFMTWVHASRVPVYAVAENPVLLQRLGFKKVAHDIYFWSWG
jgi:hypothetical protein